MRPYTKSVLATLSAVSLLAARPENEEQETAKAKPRELTLEEKVATVLPKPSEEEWLRIPWRSDFAAARAEANQSMKPLFVWMMNGNPLGCT